jgi:hypothetical protein
MLSDELSVRCVNASKAAGSLETRAGVIEDNVKFGEGLWSWVLMVAAKFCL